MPLSPDVHPVVVTPSDAAQLSFRAVRLARAIQADSCAVRRIFAALEHDLVEGMFADGVAGLRRVEAALEIAALGAQGVAASLILLDLPPATDGS